ncbi:MAG: hypothetical protein V1846_01570 [Candidatus Komeilibacteria bacterium]
MAETLQARPGLDWQPGKDYPADVRLEQQQLERDRQEQFNQQKTASRLEHYGQKSNDQADKITEVLKSGKSLRELRRLVTSATIVALVLVFLEMHLRLVVCNLFGSSLPYLAEDRLNGLEFAILVFVDWIILTLVSILLIILMPIIDPKLFVGLIIRNWWDGIVHPAATTSTVTAPVTSQ